MNDLKVKKAKGRLGAEWGNSDKSKVEGGDKIKSRRGRRHRRHVSGDCAWHSRTREERRSALALGAGPRARGGILPLG